jgi:hypothetical protein
MHKGSKLRIALANGFVILIENNATLHEILIESAHDIYFS